MINRVATLVLSGMICLSAYAQEMPPEQPPKGGQEMPAESPKRIVLEEKQVNACNKPVEMKLENGAQIRLWTGAQAFVTKYEMSDAKGKELDGIKIAEGEVGIYCPADKKVTVWVPDGNIGLEGGEHTFVVVKDGWREMCLRPAAFVEETKTGAKWQMSNQQKARVERAQRCIMITHEKDSQDRIFVWIPAGWIVYTLKGEDLKKEEEKVFSGRGIDEFPKGEPLRVPMIVRLDPADAVLIMPPDLPAGQTQAPESVVEPPTRVIRSPLGPVSPIH